MYSVAYLALCGYARTGGYVHCTCIGLHTWHCVDIPEPVDIYRVAYLALCIYARTGGYGQGCIPGIVWLCQNRWIMDIMYRVACLALCGSGLDIEKGSSPQTTRSTRSVRCSCSRNSVVPSLA